MDIYRLSSWRFQRVLAQPLCHDFIAVETSRIPGCSTSLLNGSLTRLTRYIRKYRPERNCRSVEIQIQGLVYDLTEVMYWVVSVFSPVTWKRDGLRLVGAWSALCMTLWETPGQTELRTVARMAGGMEIHTHLKKMGIVNRMQKYFGGQDNCLRVFWKLFCGKHITF